MSWVGRKISMSDDVDQKQVTQEYFDHKAKLREEEEVKKFWEEYEDEYFTGGS